MRILHLLPGETQGDTADIILTPVALDQLIGVLQQAREIKYACGRFVQRDGVEYTLCVDVREGPSNSREWRDAPMAYLQGQVRNLRYDVRAYGIDLKLLGAELYSARKKKKHNQHAAAKILGISHGTISLIERIKQEPKPENLDRICAYIGDPVGRYLTLPEY